MFRKPVADHFDVEDCAFGRADRVLEGLEAGGAEVEGKPFEGGAVGGFLGYIGAGARTVCVGGGPLGVGDLEGISQLASGVNM